MQQQTASSVPEQLSFHAAYIVLGVIPLPINMFILIVNCIIRKAKWDRWVLIATALVFVNTTLSMGYLIKSIITVEQLLNVDNTSASITEYTSLRCVCWGSILIAGSIADQLLTVAIAIDRAMAITNTKFYRVNANKIVQSILTTTALVSMLFVIFSFINVTKNDTLIQCTFTSGLTATYKSVYYTTAHVTSSLLLLVNSYLLIVIKINFQKLKQPNPWELNSVQSKELKRQIRIARKIFPLIITYCLTSVPAFSLLDILPKLVNILFSSEYMRRALMICQLLICFNACINGFLYTCNNDDIKKQLKLMLKKNNSIEPVTGNDDNLAVHVHY